MSCSSRKRLIDDDHEYDVWRNSEPSGKEEGAFEKLKKKTLVGS